jgi:putative inorganic carbon (hco3(-)) transporter
MIALLKLVAPLSVYLGGFALMLGSLGGSILPCMTLLIPLFPLENIYEKLQLFPAGKDFNDILLIGMTVGWIFSRLSKGKRLLDPTPINGLLLVYFAYTLFTLLEGSLFLGLPLFSIADVRVRMWKNYMIFILLYFLIVNNARDLRQMKWIFTVMLATMFLMDYYTIPQVRWMSGIGSRIRLHGTFVNLGPNEISAFYSTYAFVLAGVFLYERSLAKKAALAVLACICVFCVLFMYSRGAYAAILAGGITMSLLRNKAMLFPLLFLVVLWQVLLPAKVVDRIKQIETVDNSLDPSAQKRLDIWQDALAMFKKSPITGVGFATLAVKGLRYGFADPHNIYLKMLTEQGIIGLLFLLAIFLQSLIAGVRLYRRAEDGFLKGLGLGFACCVVATMVGNIFGNRWSHLQLGAFYWIFLGMVMRGNILTAK